MTLDPQHPILKLTYRLGVSHWADAFLLKGALPHEDGMVNTRLKDYFDVWFLNSNTLQAPPLAVVTHELRQLLWELTSPPRNRP